jgi:DNA-directed RNA polymerase specialized sigma24 family protein
LRKKIDIDIQEMLALKALPKPWSNQRLANKCGVSKATIKRRLREASENSTDKNVIDFSTKLAKFAAEAPDGFCRKELLRAVNIIRTRHAIPDSKRKEIILGYLKEYAPVPLEPDEIAHATGLPKKEVETLLTEMVEAKQVKRGSRGGKQNSGRRTKFHFTVLNS